MTVVNTIRKLVATFLLILVALSCVLMLVFVPFQGTTDHNRSLSPSDVDFPGTYSVDQGMFIDISDRNGINNSRLLLQEHIQNLVSSDKGEIKYTYNDNQSTIIWDENTIHITGQSQEIYMDEDEGLFKENDKKLSDTESKILRRFIDSRWSKFGNSIYDEHKPISVENRIATRVSQENFTLISSWKNENTYKEYMKYKSANSNVSIVISEDGVIKRFNDKTSKIQYSLKEDSSKPLIRPSWSYGG